MAWANKKPAAANAIELKVVLVGAKAVGKTSTVIRFTKNTFSEYLESTIGASYMAKDMEVDGHRLRFSIWDTAGQEQYHSLVPMYFRQSAAVILVYDVTKTATFLEAKEWVQEIRRNAPPDVQIAVAGNKCDLDAQRQVPASDAEEFAAAIHAFHVETSAKTSRGITELFEELGRRFLQRSEAARAPGMQLGEGRGLQRPYCRCA
eukprot:EG_transcript_23166